MATPMDQTMAAWEVIVRANMAELPAHLQVHEWAPLRSNIVVRLEDDTGLRVYIAPRGDGCFLAELWGAGNTSPADTLAEWLRKLQAGEVRAQRYANSLDEAVAAVRCTADNVLQG